VRPHIILVAVITGIGLAAAVAHAAPAPASGRVDLRLDTSEAERVLVILDKRAGGRTVAEAEWDSLFATEPYVR